MFERGGDVVNAARALIGTPFRHQGRLPGVGLDCAGVGIAVAKSIGIEITDFSGYPRTPFDGMLKKMFDAQDNLHQIDINNIAAGDVLLLRIKSAPQHVAVYVGGGYMVHAYQTVGKVVEQRIDERWLKNIVAAYRFKL